MVLICAAAYGATVAQLISQGRTALGQKQYEQAAGYFNAALTDSDGPPPTAEQIFEIKSLLVVTYMELDRLEDATRLCTEMLVAADDPDSVERVHYLNGQIAARTYYYNGIRDVRIIYQHTDDPFIAQHFVNYAIKHPNEYTTQDILDQLCCLIDHEGYSSGISSIVFRAGVYCEIEPLFLYGQLLAQRPALAADMDFLFDAGQMVGSNDNAFSIDCFTGVIEQTQDPQQKAEALLERSCLYRARIITDQIDQLAEAKADLLACQALIAQHHLTDLTDSIEEGWEVIERIENVLDNDKKYDQDMRAAFDMTEAQ